MSRSSVVYLVRHAKAGQRSAWEDDDLLRPLSKSGWKQAQAVADRLSGKRVSTLHASEYTRCVQTLEPLAERLGQEVRQEPRLTEGMPFEPVLELIAEVDDRAVMCSHGDIIPAVIEALHRRGMELQSSPDWRKASIWVLTRKGGRITQGKVWPPPSKG
jgi:8-oxo-dGTP diphosphatase